MRYAKQRTLSECGPRAIYNAFVWAGLDPVPMEKLKLQCKTNAYGTSDYQLALVLKRYFSVRRLKLPKVWKLKQGEAVVLGYCRKDEGEVSGHYVLIEKLEGDKFKIVNHIPHKYFSSVNKDTMHLFETEKIVSLKFLRRFLKPPLIKGLRWLPDIFKIGASK